MTTETAGTGAHRCGRLNGGRACTVRRDLSVLVGSPRGRYGFCITCGKKADHYCSQTKDPVCSRECKQVRPQPRPRRPWPSTKPPNTAGDTHTGRGAWIGSQINLERIETDARQRREDAGTVADLEQVAEPNAAVDRASAPPFFRRALELPRSHPGLPASCGLSAALGGVRPQPRAGLITRTSPRWPPTARSCARTSSCSSAGSGTAQCQLGPGGSGPAPHRLIHATCARGVARVASCGAAGTACSPNRPTTAYTRKRRRRMR